MPDRMSTALPDELRRVAEGVKGFMPTEKGLALHRAGLEHLTDGGLGVEIGSYCGKSTVYLGYAARVRRATIVTLDHHRGSEEHQAGWEYHDAELVGEDGRIDTLPWLRSTLAAAGVEDVVTPVVGRSADVARWWRTPARPGLRRRRSHRRARPQRPARLGALDTGRRCPGDPRRLRRSRRRRPAPPPHLS